MSSFLTVRRWPAASVLAFVSCLVAAGQPAGAQEAAYPSRPIQMVVPYGSGSADVVPRLAAAVVQDQTGANFVVDNRPGAGGLVGTQYVLRQPADGYHILMAATNNLAINQFVFAKQELDPLAVLAPVAKLTTVPLIVAVNADLPITTLDDFVRYAKTPGNRLDFSSPSVGTTPHIAAESFLHTLGLKGMHVPYKGGVAVATSVASGEVQFAVIAYATLSSVIEAGRVRPLAVISQERLAVMPDVPTVAEAGYPQLLETVLPNWWAVTVRQGTPPEIIDRLAGMFERALADPALQERYRQMGMFASFEGPAQMSANLPKEAEVWRELVKRLDIRVD